jgi:lysozyme
MAAPQLQCSSIPSPYPVPSLDSRPAKTGCGRLATEEGPVSESLREMVMRHEGLRLKAYLDTTGHWTIGYGHLLDKAIPDITQAEADKMLDEDIAHAEMVCAILYGASPGMTQRRHDALTDLIFNIGSKGAMKFVRMNAAIKKGDWLTASKELQSSKWFGQVGPTRGPDLVKMLKEG